MSKEHFDNKKDVVDATISSGAAESEVVGLGGCELVGMRLPNVALTNTSYWFETSIDANVGNWGVLYNEAGAKITVTVPSPTAIRHVPLDPIVFLHARHIKVVGASNETADRAIKLIVKHLG